MRRISNEKYIKVRNDYYLLYWNGIDIFTNKEYAITWSGIFGYISSGTKQHAKCMSESELFDLLLDKKNNMYNNKVYNKTNLNDVVFKLQALGNKHFSNNKHRKEMDTLVLEIDNTWEQIKKDIKIYQEEFSNILNNVKKTLNKKTFYKNFMENIRESIEYENIEITKDDIIDLIYNKNIQASILNRLFILYPEIINEIDIDKIAGNKNDKKAYLYTTSKFISFLKTQFFKIHPTLATTIITEENLSKWSTALFLECLSNTSMNKAKRDLETFQKYLNTVKQI